MVLLSKTRSAMPAPAVIPDLVKRFEEQGDAYKSGAYNEAQLRQEFIDPMFKALGWDMDNVSGYAEAYKDVIHEDAIKIGGATKAPDYCFRIGGTRKFFLEAKKPSIDIKHDASPAYQLRRYAWSAKLPLSILTDFEEFAVYDSRVEPRLDDKASVARVLYLNFHEYVPNWDDIAKIFARDAILKGSFDKFAESTKAKRGTAEVDDAFLSEIEQWRADLARNLALRNPTLSQRDLNFSVQRTIDRMVFLRICEDRRIEVYGRLQALLNGEHTYRRLYQLFREADQRYNSGLFYFQKEKDRVEPPDDLTPELEIDDAVLKKIIRRLYYPESPYEFSVLPADILGQVYEQFLGKVIRLTEGHQARVEDKPEVKKAGGVYYTPTYIVDHIVKNTVGKLLKNKTPKQIAKLRILDSACGSGSFLIGAYQHLLDWHRDWYSDNDPKKWATGKNPVIYQGPGGEWKLTTSERKRILLQNIYGVDIDAQAVEVTKLSLLLKVLEGESEQTLATQLRFFHERALPDLGRNIKCGNSLIGPDFYDQQEMDFLNEEQRYRINVFDWKGRDGFPEIMKAGGFDAVIGNPPYLRVQGLQEYYGNQIEYFATNYESAVKRFDFYLLFTERAYKLLNSNGRVGFICPHKFLNSDFGSGLRNFLVRNHAIESFLSFGNNLVFHQASTYTGILILSKKENASLAFFRIPDVPVGDLPLRLAAVKPSDFSSYEITKLGSEPWALMSLSHHSLLDKLRKQPATVETIFEGVFQGVVTGIDELYFVTPIRDSGDLVEVETLRDERRIKLEKAILKPMLKGEDVSRYAESRARFRCIYPYKLIGERTVILEEAEFSTRFPFAYAYISEFKSELRGLRVKYKTNPKYWYSCHRSRSMAAFVRERIITQEISLGCNMTLDREGLYHNTKVYSLLPTPSIQESILYWLGILNSKLMWWFLKNTGYVLRGGYFTFKTEYLNPFPLPRVMFSQPASKARHQRMISLVERMMGLHKQLAGAKTGHDKTNLQRQIDATDAQIDKLVYELYELTPDEIKIVEAASQ